MIFAICMGTLSAFVVLIVMARIGIKKFMGYPAFMDAGVTVILAWLLHGSYVGMVAAIIGGLVFSGMITVIRRMYGYSKLERRGLRLVWVDYESKWYTQMKENLNERKTTMLELKIIKGVNRIYRGIVRLGLRSVNARDKRALRKLDASLDHAQDTRDLARKLRREADVIEDTHLDYAIKQRQINSAHNLLSNALDDLTLDL